MRSTSSAAIILALIMLLLVLAAAFVFLFQGRQTLVGQRDALATSVAGLEVTREQLDLAFQSVEATRLATAEELATAVADTILYESQLVASQQQVDDLTAQVDSLAVELTASITPTTEVENAAETETEALPPEVRIVLPAADTAVSVGDEIEIVFVAADPVGIATANLLINGESFKTYDPADATLYSARETWIPEEAGDVEIGVLAVNVDGRASNPTTIIITVGPRGAQNNAAQSQTDDPNAALRAEIENRVADMRGLVPTEPVITTLLSREELTQRVEEDLLAEFTAVDAHNDVLTMSAFDMLPPDFDLFTFSRDLYSEQIAGFYDPETNEFVVVSEDDELDANEQLTHAHEYMHALQDQHFELDLLDDDGRDADASAALLSLAEGEATLMQMLYMLQGYVDIAEILASAGELATPVLDSAPTILANSLLFPYTTGFEFAQTLYQQDGLVGLDAVWEELPQSTEQILHPERYLAGDMPQLVALPPLTDTLGAGWALVDEDVFGEFMLREYLGQELNAEQTDTAATGWGGDRYAVYTNETDAAQVMVLRLVWDTDDDATEFAALYPNYPAALLDTSSQLQGNGGECWQGVENAICLFQSGRETTIVRAPDVETAVAIMEEIERVGD